MMRHCNKCKGFKEFNRHPTKKWQALCRDCNAARSRAYYNSNKEKHKKIIKANSKRYLVENQKRICEYLQKHPCVDCGNSDILVLQFDHISNKDREVTMMLRGNCGWARLQKEIEKCEIRCANCHTRKTLKAVNSYKVKFVESLNIPT